MHDHGVMILAVGGADEEAITDDDGTGVDDAVAVVVFGSEYVGVVDCEAPGGKFDIDVETDGTAEPEPDIDGNGDAVPPTEIDADANMDTVGDVDGA